MKSIFFALALLITLGAEAQKANSVINETEVRRLLTTLSSDAMQGRRTGTPAIDAAADFISTEFAKAGLQPFQGLTGFKQTFNMIRPSTLSVQGTVNGQQIDAGNVVAFSSSENLVVNDKSGYEKVVVKAGDNFLVQARQLMSSKKNMVVIVDTSFSKMFASLNRFKRLQFASPNNTVFILSALPVQTFSITSTQQIEAFKLTNVVGILPGKSRKDEYVVFSGHYDHLGIGKAVNGDSIYNGANDDASGTTAVMMLAKYYKALGNNQRTLVFAAFTAEEIGGYGSQYFSRQLSADKVAAMFNIEMIGTESKWNKASAYITGYEKTNMGNILQKNLQGSAFTFHPDPYTDQQLFYRSDNATLARLGVPAHTISTSKMDSEPNYHKASDEIGTLDLSNMTEIIKAIAVSAQSIVAGSDTPTRVNTSELVR